MSNYRCVDLPSDEPVQFVGVYVLRWRREWGEPAVGFAPVEEETVPDNVVWLDRRELADLRRQLAEAQESLQASVELNQIREEQLRDELARAERAETQLAEAQAEIATAHTQIDQWHYGIPTVDEGHTLSLSERISDMATLVANERQCLAECEGRYREPLTLELRREFLALPMHWRRRLMGSQADAMVARQETEKLKVERDQLLVLISPWPGPGTMKQLARISGRAWSEETEGWCRELHKSYCEASRDVLRRGLGAQKGGEG